MSTTLAEPIPCGTSPSVQIERVAFRALDEDELANLADALEAANA